MSKFVTFVFDNHNIQDFRVKDFTLENVQGLKVYNSNWFQMSFTNGTKVVKNIYRGKKVSYELVRQLVGNNLKYEDLLFSMDLNCRNAFSALNLNIHDFEEYKKKLEDFKKEYYKTHFCLFTLPDRFSANALMDDNSITIEEFDNNVKLNYSENLKAIGQNAVVGEDYIKEHKFLLELFNNYFIMLIKSCRSLPPQHQNTVFDTIYFHFENFENLMDREDVNFFLDICDYTYGYSNSNSELFNNYRKYINKKYDELENGTGISLE